MDYDSRLQCLFAEFYRKLLMMGVGFLLTETVVGLSSHGQRLYTYDLNKAIYYHRQWMKYIKTAVADRVKATPET
jgi:hypothetical protein